MNKIETEVINLIKSSSAYLSEGLSNGINFVLAEGKEIVTQYLLYTSILHALPILLGIVLIILGIKSTKYFITNVPIDNKEDVTDEYLVDKPIKVMRHYYTEGYYAVIHYAVKIGAFAFAFSLIFNNIMQFIKVTFFPKLYLFELVTEFIK